MLLATLLVCWLERQNINTIKQSMGFPAIVPMHSPIFALTFLFTVVDLLYVIMWWLSGAFMCELARTNWHLCFALALLWEPISGSRQTPVLPESRAFLQPLGFTSWMDPHCSPLKHHQTAPHDTTRSHPVTSPSWPHLSVSDFRALEIYPLYTQMFLPKLPTPRFPHCFPSLVL